MKPSFKKITESTAFYGGPFFIYHAVLGADRVVLIEPGISQLVPQVLTDLREGLGVSAPDTLVALHSHFDHAGGASRWKIELPDAALLASPATARALVNEPGFPGYLRSMKSTAANPFFKTFFPLADDEPIMESVVVDRELNEGDSIDLGGGDSLEVVNTPGHSACSISLYNTRARTLFISDACGLPLPSGRIWPTAFHDRSLYSESIRKLIAFEPEHLCTGHMPPMSGADRIRRFFEKNLDASDRFFARIETLWNELADRDAVLAALFADYKNDVSAIEFVVKFGNREMVRQVVGR
jgi:2-aminobenzoylacetyl-CoA thioesterase